MGRNTLLFGEKRVSFGIGDGFRTREANPKALRVAVSLLVLWGCSGSAYSRIIGFRHQHTQGFVFKAMIRNLEDVP